MKKKSQKKKKKTIPERVFAHLKGKPLRTKDKIAKEMKLSISSINRACTILRKQKKIVVMRCGWGAHVKTYWGRI